MSGIRTGVYPGTFDPIHNGHLDVIRRACKLVDRLIVAVAENAGKEPLLDLETRRVLVQRDLDALVARNGANGCTLEVVSFNNLLVQLAADVQADVIIRGLRAVSDFEYEFQMASNNYRLESRVETIFLMASETTQFISSRFVKEIGRLGGDISSFVSPDVLSYLHAHVLKR